MSDMKGGEKRLTPREFALCVKQNKDKIAKIKQQQKQLVAAERQKLANERQPLDRQKTFLNNKYLLDNPLGIMVYVDRVEINGRKLYYVDGLSVKYEMRKERVARRLKNGQIRYSTKNIKHLVFATNSGEYDVTVDAKVAEIRAAIECIEAAIERYPELKNSLDIEIAKIDDQITSLNAKCDNEIAKINAKAESIIDATQTLIDNMITSATKPQLRELHIGRTIAKRVAAVLLVIFVVSGIIGSIASSTERGRNYYINADDTYTFDCNLSYDDSNQTFQCTTREISGYYSKYDTAELKGDNTSINGDKFVSKVEAPIIGADIYRSAEYSTEKVVGEYSKTDVRLELYNTYLKEVVLSKSIKVIWKYSDADLAKITTKHQEWQAEQDRKATEKAAEEKRKAEEETAKKAAEEAKKAQEEAAEKARLEAEVRQRTRQVQTTTRSTNASSTNSNNSSGNSGSSSNSPNSGATNNVYGYCNDGLDVYGNPSARGKANKCYGHGGWRDY